MSLQTIQEWTKEKLNIDTKCRYCNTEMIPGYAINPSSLWESCLSCMPIGNLRYEDIEIVMVLKCPKCGQSEEIEKDALKEPPPGFQNWNNYWRSPIQQRK